MWSHLDHDDFSQKLVGCPHPLQLWKIWMGRQKLYRANGPRPRVSNWNEYIIPGAPEVHLTRTSARTRHVVSPESIRFESFEAAIKPRPLPLSPTVGPTHQKNQTQLWNTSCLTEVPVERCNLRAKWMQLEPIKVQVWVGEFSLRSGPCL